MDLFTGKPIAEELFQALLPRIGENGDFTVEVKKTSVHVVAGKGAFLGAHPRATGLLLNIPLDRAIDSTRIARTEQVSRGRFHNEVKISDPAEIDAELLGWIAEAYALKTA